MHRATPPSNAKVFSDTHFAMRKELGPEQILAARCPTCGAEPGTKCEMSTGQPRIEHIVVAD
jgi:hypothetical protein